MPSLSRYEFSRNPLRNSGIALLLASALTSCDRFKERFGTGNSRNSSVGQMAQSFDSNAARRDSILRRNKAAQDSLAAVNAVLLTTDSITHGARRPGAAASVPIPTQPLTRAQILGDSIANAQIEKLNGQNRNVGAGDTLRGVVQLDGSGVGSRPILLANGGKTTITLSGMGTEGLSQVVGSDVVVRGMRVSPRDIVVSGFSVRAVNGIPTIDGRLVKSSDGWVIELSDKSGVRKLAAVPQALQAFEGARVWVAEEVKNAMPQLYGVIARR
ncbi:MAG: hypothetical protein ABJB74_16165 [Gemmatimonas sp.]